MSKIECTQGMSKPEIIKHIFKKILFFIFFFMRREMKKGPEKHNEK